MEGFPQPQIGNPVEPFLLLKPLPMRLICLFFLLLTACATRYSVPEDYSEKLESRSEKHSGSTTVFFLIDGLSIQTLNHGLRHQSVANIKQHFLGPHQSMRKAHSIFPSLTFPNISSLLHEKPVHETGAIGNSVVYQGRLISFESVFDRGQFSEMMRGQNIFTRLNEKGLHSVSLDYGLGIDATVASDALDLKTGLALQLQDYLYLDKKRIDSLKLLLLQNSVDQWPDFIFIHLVGVDFLSHQYGPQSEKAYEYLSILDQSLKEVFELLRNAESKIGHKVVSILSADHGFNPETIHHIAIEETIAAVAPEMQVINEGRLAALYSAKNPTSEQMGLWTSKFIKSQGVEIVSFRLGNRIQIFSKSLQVTVDLQSSLLCPNNSFGVSINNGPSVCPQKLEPSQRDLYFPFFIENLISYFQAEKHPDLLLIPNHTTAFQDGEVGYHGGPTPEETLVPLLMRNATVKNPSLIPANWQLLQFL